MMSIQPVIDVSCLYCLSSIESMLTLMSQCEASNSIEKLCLGVICHGCLEWSFYLEVDGTRKQRQTEAAFLSKSPT